MRLRILAAVTAAALTSASTSAFASDVDYLPGLGGAVLFGTGAVLVSFTTAVAGTGLSTVQLVYVDEPSTPGLATAGYVSAGLNLAAGAGMLALVFGGGDVKGCTAFCRLGVSNLVVGLLNLTTSAVLTHREREASSGLTLRPVLGWETGTTQVGIVVSGF